MGGPLRNRVGPVVTEIPVGDRRLLMRPHGCFACGELNVSGLRLQLHADDDLCWAEPTLDERFMGWEGIAHGGIVCAILDEVMAWALVGEDCWGLTARISVDFRRPVPVGMRLRAEGRVVERRRRAIRTEGRLLDAATGALHATAEAVYIDAPPERKAELKRRYEFRIEPAVRAEERSARWPWPRRGGDAEVRATTRGSAVPEAAAGEKIG
jgi:uncharacterized protein (TIGR00369 family)